MDVGFSFCRRGAGKAVDCRAAVVLIQGWAARRRGNPGSVKGISACICSTVREVARG